MKRSPKPRLLSTEEAARLLNVSRWTIYELVKTGRLVACELVAGKYLFSMQAIEAAIARGERRERRTALAAAGPSELRLHSS